MATMKPRPHQLKAINAAVREFKTKSRTQVIMACGSGKTLVGLAVSQKLKASSIVVFVPSLALVKQTMLAYRQYLKGVNLSSLAVCSESLADADIDATTNEDTLGAFLGKRGPKIVLCTYQSAHLLADKRFDLGVFDEAHKTAGELDKSFQFALANSNIHIKKRLFLTATPRRDIGADTRLADRDILDMTDEKMYGRVAYHLSFREAVKLGVVCDYKVVVSVVTDETIDITKRSATQTSVFKAMEAYKLDKAFVYYRTIDEAKAWAENAHSSHIFPRSIKVLHVSGKQTKRERKASVKMFEATKRGVLTNSRYLIEGVDFPSVDMTVFASPKKSIVDVTQAVGRAVRKHPGKKIGYVLIPIFIKSGESLQQAIATAKLEGLQEVLQTIRDTDESFADSVFSHWDSEEGEDELFEIEVVGAKDAAKLKRALSVRIANVLMPTMEVNIRNLIKRAKAGDVRPSSHSADPDVGHLGRALSRYTKPSQLSRYREFNKEIRALRPDWFENSADARKRRFLAAAKAGKPPPSWNKRRKDAEMLRLYLTKGSKVYDAAFAEELAKTSKRWGVNKNDKSGEKKEQLLAMAKRGEEKPKHATKGKAVNSLRAALNRYTLPKSESYDAEFAKKIRKASDWLSR
jgi:superfamily II DNA or RNA helicase